MKLSKPALHKAASLPTRSSREESSLLANRGQGGSSHCPCLYKTSNRQREPGNAHTQAHSVGAHSPLCFTERVSILRKKCLYPMGLCKHGPYYRFSGKTVSAAQAADLQRQRGTAVIPTEYSGRQFSAQPNMYYSARTFK